MVRFAHCIAVLNPPRTRDGSQQHGQHDEERSKLITNFLSIRRLSSNMLVLRFRCRKIRVVSST
ncbi:hypothetical protein M378DRAFT_162858 [Amanita muscaria Koide BX008]|uniref:Uncharacterized protein n=1 Tax=Amanita muscaria (strain Koide BX008) TaxID=946122 RepID=A0A0C2X627_AMAMK|nr:hypothetical protein M378DRAFT_162858 [Amanita muscaria Koide BX008]